MIEELYTDINHCELSPIHDQMGLQVIISNPHP